jgi:hypothetical protein
LPSHDTKLLFYRALTIWQLTLIQFLCFSGVSKLLGFASEDPNVPLVSLNHRIEEVFSLAQTALIHTIEHPESANNPQISTDSSARQVHEELLFNSLRHLWKEWLRICTTTVTVILPLF